MGYARQLRRQEKHENGAFDARKAEIRARTKMTAPFNVRFYLVNRKTGNVKKSFIGGTSLLSDRIEFVIRTNPQSRLVKVKRSICKRWVKPEHPIATRRRLKAEQAENERARAARRLPLTA